MPKTKRPDVTEERPASISKRELEILQAHVISTQQRRQLLMLEEQALQSMVALVLLSRKLDPEKYILDAQTGAITSRDSAQVADAG